MDQDIINQFQTERKGRASFVVVEGYHALKHAFRFGAEIESVYVLDSFATLNFGETVRDEKFEDFLRERAVRISEPDFGFFTQGATRTGIIARVKKSSHSLEEVFLSHGRIVVLENPRDLSNLGAVVRVCAARGDTSLIITGEASVWHAHAIRGGAGLQWALPVTHASLEDVFTFVGRQGSDYKIFACTDEGDSMYESDLSGKSVLIFGTEREGITESTRVRADQKIAIPMQEGVSSMNLATSVSAVLFSSRA